MQQQKIRILGIAPYQSLKTSMDATAGLYENIELVTYVGDLDVGAQLAKQYMNDGFDIIISRGGTAALIRKFSTVPVIEISLTAYDILRTLQLTSASAQACAVIGFPSITIPAGTLCDLLHYDMKIITIHSKAQAAQALETLKETGRHFVLCDVVTETLARQAGLSPILIASGSESIRSAFEEAIRICSFSSGLMQKCAILEEALKKQPSNTIILKADGKVLYSNYDSENMNPVSPGITKDGLRYTSYANMANLYTNSFFALTQSAQVLEKQISQLTNAGMPVMILGERGTGKNQVAAKLYMESPLKQNPYIIIDCPLIHERNWNYLIKHYNSPLFDKGNTIFISNIQTLSEIRRQQLLSLILDTNAHKRNRILFSCSQTLEKNTVDPSEQFINDLTCATIYLAPLRELTADIPSSSSLYLNTLNLQLSRQVTGFEPEALELLCSYHWPDNFEQLKRVLADLVLLTTGQLIQTQTVQKVLEKESRRYIAAPMDSFDYDRPLNIMIKDIIKTVLAKCDGNQTKAAKQLSIGRTTLWRYLKSEE